MLLTIESAGRVLALYTAETPERGVTEVAAELGVSKSKAHALLASLTHVGLLRRTANGRYRLGWRLLSLNRVLDDTTEFRRFARPIMRTLTLKFGVTTHLAALHDGQVLYLERTMGSAGPSLGVSRVGALLPAHCSAVGKMLMSALDAETLEQLVAERGLPPVTERTLTTRARLENELAAVRQHAHASERDEAVSGISCLAAPIVALGASMVGAISISAPSSVLAAREDVYRRAVIAAGLHISRRTQESASDTEMAAEFLAGADVAVGHGARAA